MALVQLDQTSLDTLNGKVVVLTGGATGMDVLRWSNSMSSILSTTPEAQ